MEFKVGDKVRIKNDAYHGFDPDLRMAKWRGQIVTIRRHDEDRRYYYIEEDVQDFSGNTYPGWIWDERDLEPAPNIDLSEMRDSLSAFL